MSHSPAPGATWGMRLWLFVVALASATSLAVHREVDLPRYTLLPLGIVILYGFYSAGAALRAAHVPRTA